MVFLKEAYFKNANQTPQKMLTQAGCARLLVPILIRRY